MTRENSSPKWVGWLALVTATGIFALILGDASDVPAAQGGQAEATPTMDVVSAATAYSSLATTATAGAAAAEQTQASLTTQIAELDAALIYLATTAAQAQGDGAESPTEFPTTTPISRANTPIPSASVPTSAATATNVEPAPPPSATLEELDRVLQGFGSICYLETQDEATGIVGKHVFPIPVAPLPAGEKRCDYDLNQPEAGLSTSDTAVQLAVRKESNLFATVQPSIPNDAEIAEVNATATTIGLRVEMLACLGQFASYVGDSSGASGDVSVVFASDYLLTITAPRDQGIAFAQKALERLQQTSMCRCPSASATGKQFALARPQPAMTSEEGTPASCQEPTTRIDIHWDVIAEREDRRLIGYAPAVGLSVSGVSLATGVDLGQMSDPHIMNLAVSDNVLKEKLATYASLKGDLAGRSLEDNPLEIDEKQATEIDNAYQTVFIQSLVDLYDASTTGALFAELPWQAQTVVASVFYPYGTNVTGRIGQSSFGALSHSKSGRTPISNFVNSTTPISRVTTKKQRC